MADGDSTTPQSDLGAARQQDLDGQSGGISFSLTPGSGPGKLKVRYPGLDEFEIDPDGLKSWLQEHNLIHSPQQWTALDQMIQDAIQGGGTGRQEPPGHYNWDDQTQRPGTASDAQAEQMNEQQSQAWQRLLDAWNGFAGYVQNLRGALSSDGETVIQRCQRRDHVTQPHRLQLVGPDVLGRVQRVEPDRRRRLESRQLAARSGCRGGCG